MVEYSNIVSCFSKEVKPSTLYIVCSNSGSCVKKSDSVSRLASGSPLKARIINSSGRLAKLMDQLERRRRRRNIMTACCVTVEQVWSVARYGPRRQSSW